MADHIARTFFTPEFVDASPAIVDWLVRAFWDHRPSLEEYLRHVVARQEHQTADRLGGDHGPDARPRRRSRHAMSPGPGVHRDQSAYLAEHIPGSTLVVLPGVTHGYFWQTPEAAGAASSSTGPPAALTAAGQPSGVARRGGEADRVAAPAGESLGPRVALRRPGPGPGAMPRRANAWSIEGDEAEDVLVVDARTSRASGTRRRPSGPGTGGRPPRTTGPSAGRPRSIVRSGSNASGSAPN